MDAYGPLLRAWLRIDQMDVNQFGNPVTAQLFRRIALSAIEGRPINIRSLASWANLSNDTVRRRLAELESKGWVRVVPTRGLGYNLSPTQTAIEVIGPHIRACFQIASEALAEFLT